MSQKRLFPMNILLDILFSIKENRWKKRHFQLHKIEWFGHLTNYFPGMYKWPFLYIWSLINYIYSHIQYSSFWVLKWFHCIYCNVLKAINVFFSFWYLKVIHVGVRPWIHKTNTILNKNKRKAISQREDNVLTWTFHLCKSCTNNSITHTQNQC